MLPTDLNLDSVTARPASPQFGRGRLVAAALLVSTALALPGCAKRSASGAPDAAATPDATATTGPSAKAAGTDPDEVVVDPFCGMKIKRGEAAASAEWQGAKYWFCLADHREAFLADPQRALCRPAGGDAGPECDGR